MNYSNQQLQEMDYQELCSLVEQNIITWSQWIDAQPDLYEGYDDWLAQQGLERDDTNALMFIHQVEKQDMEGQVSNEMNERLTMIDKARKALKVSMNSEN